jgi:hypothetical protein
MISSVIKSFIVALLLAVSGSAAYAQNDMPDASQSTLRPRRSEETPRGMPEMLAKQRTERDKRDHKEMLERGEQALRLTNQLEASFVQNKSFSREDETKLVSLEKVVIKIREELGGDDEGESRDDANYLKSTDEPRPSTAEEAFKFLQSTTVKLVDELKKTTRFTISVIAIQSSNSVLKLVKFLRLRK